MEEPKIGDLLTEDPYNHFASRILSLLLDQDEVLNGVLRAIPKDWEYSEMELGENPTKETLAYGWLWELIANS